MSESNIIAFPAAAKRPEPAGTSAGLTELDADRLAQMSRVLAVMKDIHADLEALRKTLKADLGVSR